MSNDRRIPVYSTASSYTGALQGAGNVDAVQALDAVTEAGRLALEEWTDTH